MASHVMHDAADFVATALVDRVRSTARSFAEWRAKRAKRAQLARELLSYTDRELFDIGISRGDIPAVINGTYSRS